MKKYKHVFEKKSENGKITSANYKCKFCGKEYYFIDGIVNILPLNVSICSKSNVEIGSFELFKGRVDCR